jgi:hypothetical protein
MPYDFVDASTDMAILNGLDTKENMHLYSTTYSTADRYKHDVRQENVRAFSLTQFHRLCSNTMITSDLWSTTSSSYNSNPTNSSFYFPASSSSSSSFDVNMSSHPSQYSTMIDNSNYDYSLVPDVNSSYMSESSYSSQMFPSNYCLDPYVNSTSYSSTSMDYGSSNYLPATGDVYQHTHPMYTTSAVPTTYLSSASIDMQQDYQPAIAQWDTGTGKMSSHDGT